MEQIVINQNDRQQINISSNEPQFIRLSNNNPQDININLNKIQDVSIKNSDNQILYVEETGSVIGINDVLVNGVSVVSNNVAYVIVPTKTSEIINDSGYITSENDPTVPYYIKEITISDINSWNNKQNLLVSGSNIKTINGNSLLGSGNLSIGTDYTAGIGININSENVISNTITSYNDLNDLPTIPTETSELINDSGYVTSSDLSSVAFTGSYDDLIDEPTVPTNTSELVNDSGYIDKNVNDLTYYTLSSNLSAVATSGDYDDLTNKPTIPTVNDGILTIQKNSTNIDTFSANSSSNKTINITVPTQTSDLTNNSNFAVTNANNNFSTGQSITGSLNISGEITNVYFDMFNDTSGTDWQTMIKNKIDYAISTLNTSKINTSCFIGGGWQGINYGFGIYCKTGINHQIIWFSSNHVYYCRKSGNNYSTSQLI